MPLPVATCPTRRPRPSKGSGGLARALLAFALLALLSPVAAASSLYGPLANFDVVNDTGDDTCGFEIEIEGISGADVYRTFAAPYIRYGAPRILDGPRGVIVRYEAEWDEEAGAWLQRTPPAPPGYVPGPDSCWTVGLGPAYETSGCEHFGVSHRRQATRVHYRWLGCNPDGTTWPLPELPLPSPAWRVVPPAAPADPPRVEAEMEIPNPEGEPYGPAWWVRVYKVEFEDEVTLDDLLMENAAVAGAEVEIEWELLQAKPGEGLAVNEAPVAPGARSVVRRYEFYRYNEAWGRNHTFPDPETGRPVPYVDPDNGEVQACVVDGCNDPTPDELGDYVGRQIAAFNFVEPACANGADDDGDGLVDFPDDPGCSFEFGELEDPGCQDGVDGDGDGLVDFDGGESIHGACTGGACPPGVSDPDGDGRPDPDPGCFGRASKRKERGACGLGAELALLLPLLLAVRRRLVGTEA